MYIMIIKDIDYDNFENYMTNNGISIRPLFYDLRKHTHLSNLKYEYDEVKIFNNGFFLPSYPELSFNEQIYIINIILKYL